VTRQTLIVIGILIPTLLVRINLQILSYFCIFQILLTEVFRTLAWERQQPHLFRTYEYRDRNVHRLIVRLYVFIGKRDSFGSLCIVAGL
jgi:hypothetical protein